MTVLAAVLLALSAGVVAGVLVDARMTGVAQAATGDYTAFAWGSDGYFSGLKRGAKPVIDNETNESGVAAQNVGWENTPTIKFGKEGRFKDPSDSSRNADVSGNYKAIGIGPVTSVDASQNIENSVVANQWTCASLVCHSHSTDILGGEALLFADDSVGSTKWAIDGSGGVSSGNLWNFFDHSTASYISKVATAMKTIKASNYSSFEQVNLDATSRTVPGVCTKTYGTSSISGAAILGCIQYPSSANKSVSTYSVFPLASGDFNIFLGYRLYSTSIQNANMACPVVSVDEESGTKTRACGGDLLIQYYWTRSADWSGAGGASRYGTNPQGINAVGVPVSLHSGEANVRGLRPAARISLANLVVTTTSSGAQPVASSDELYLTFADSAKSLSNYAASFDGAVLALQGTHTLDANKQLGWKIIEKGEEPEAVVASGRVTTSGADNSASVNLGALGLDTSKNYDIWYWGHKSGSATEGWSNTATVPQKFTIDTEDWEEPEPGVDLDKSAPVVSCPSDVSVVGYDRCAVWWDVVVSNTGGVALDGVVLSDRVSSVVDDVLVEVKEGGSGVLTTSSTSPVVGGFVTRAYGLPDVVVSGSVRVRVSGSVERALVDVVVVNQAWVTADGVPRDVPDAPIVPGVAQVAAGSWDTGVPSANRWDAEPLDGVPGNAECTSDADASGVGDACDQVPAVIVHREVPVVPEEPGLDVDKSAPEVSCPDSGGEGHGACAVSWDVRVSNTGNVALGGVGLSDRLSSSVSGVGVSETPSFTAVSAGGSGGVGVDARGRVWAWGDPVFSGDPGASGTGPWLVAEQAPVMQDVVFTRVSAGDRHVVALDEDGRVWSWGANDAYQSGDGSKTETDAQLRPRVMGVDYAVVKMGGVVFAQVAAGGAHSVAVDEDGRVWSWGANGSYQSGDGTKTENAGQMEPRIMGVDYAVAKMQDVVFTGVDAGATHTVALDGDGRAWVWGNNAQRQSGDNSNGVTSAKVSPRVIGVDITGQYNDDDDPVLSGVVFTAVSAGGDQTVALDDDGGVWRWGSFAGEADGGEGARKPALVSSYMSVMQGVVFTAVSAGGMHAVALGEDGRVWSWGNNGAGQSGDGTDDNDEANYQARVMGESGYATAMAGEVYGSVSAGGSYSRALDASGRLWSWGDGTGAGGVGGVLADGVSDGSNALSVPFTVSGVGGVNRDAFERSVPLGSSSSLSGWMWWS